MPKCNHCGAILATAEMRRSPKGGFICRDKARCKSMASAARAVSRLFVFKR